MAAELAAAEHLLFVCPRYEGVDHRVRGDGRPGAVGRRLRVSGGELPAMIVIDAVLRLLPGAIDAASTVEESFADGLLEYPQYTRPAEFEGESVPEILLSGDHGAVDALAAGAGSASADTGAPALI